MKIYHFTNKKIWVIRPRLPEHSYTKSYGMPLSYWFSKPKNFEPYTISGKYLYWGEIPKDQLYNLSKNHLRLPVNSPAAIATSLRFLKNAGYLGVYVRLSGYELVTLFYNQAVRVFGKGNVCLPAKKRGR